MAHANMILLNKVDDDEGEIAKMATPANAVAAPNKRSWGESLRAFLHPRVITMLFLGFSAGVPILLIFSTLSLWLKEADVSRSTITFFSWAALGYSFKFVWAPIIDKLPLPGLTRWLGRRRAWLLVAQFAIIAAIAWMALTDPKASLMTMALAAILLGFSSATQDIVIDAYRIESADDDLQALMAATYIAGYRIGMLVAGAGALYLAEYFGSTEEIYHYQAWQWTYLCMAAVMLIGVLTTLIIAEPKRGKSTSTFFHDTSDYLRFLLLFVIVACAFACTFFFISSPLYDQIFSTLEWTGPLAKFLDGCLTMMTALLIAVFVGFMAVKVGLAPREMLQETYIEPALDFVRRYGKAALVILLLIGLYRIADIVMGVIANVFYADIGFDKKEIANITKVFGLLMTILGGFLGGLLSVRFGLMPILFVGALLTAVTNILFALLAQIGADINMLAVVIAADNLSAGLASAVFVAYLSSLTNISFTAIQYAVFSSLMTLLPKLTAGYSGSMVDSMGYEWFFIMTAILGIPVLFLVWWAAKITPTSAKEST